jgi:hypothetical protein
MASALAGVLTPSMARSTPYRSIWSTVQAAWSSTSAASGMFLNIYSTGILTKFLEAWSRNRGCMKAYHSRLSCPGMFIIKSMTPMSVG